MPQTNHLTYIKIYRFVFCAVYSAVLQKYTSEYTILLYQKIQSVYNEYTVYCLAENSNLRHSMNNTLESIKYAMSMVGIFVCVGLVASGFFWLFELVTGYTANLFKLAGY